ncbi:hypothetical protein E4U16_000908 [Claviceps sp. LM84 group G4]|nr:hypothetical protein E4U16_000908 [Claviceps sp. LM84 group G4]
MVRFDSYTGPPYYKDDPDRATVVPIFRQKSRHIFKGRPCTRTQFPLTVAYKFAVSMTRAPMQIGRTWERPPAMLRFNLSSLRTRVVGLDPLAPQEIHVVAIVLGDSSLRGADVHSVAKRFLSRRE